MVNFKFLWQEFNLSRNILASLRSGMMVKVLSKYIALIESEELVFLFQFFLYRTHERVGKIMAPGENP